MATSTVPAMKLSLQTLLVARAGLTGVQVSYGPPAASVERESIWIGDADGQQTYAAMAAGNQRLEEYDLTVVVQVIREGTGQQATDERCFALQAELENQIRSDKTVGGVVTDAQVGRFKLTEDVTSDGMTRTARLVTLVTCQAYI